MGARCNFIFKHSKDSAVALYSHWGETTAHEDLAAALKHASPRLEMKDAAYATRMVISYLIQDSILDETGFGIYPVDPNNLGMMDYPIIIDLVNHTVEDVTGIHDIGKYVEYHLSSLV